MKSRSSITIAILLAGIFVGSVYASHSQSLEWGYDEGQRYYFMREEYFEDNGDVGVIQENYYFVAPEFGEIPDPLMNDSYLPWASFENFYLNGSTPEPGSSYHLALPIGNWSLYEAILERSSEEENTTLHYIDTHSEWGYNVTIWEFNIYRFSTLTVLSKQDGVLLHRVYDYQFPTENYTMRFSLIRLPLNPEVQSMLLTGLALGSTVVVIVVYSKRHSRNAKEHDCAASVIE